MAPDEVTVRAPIPLTMRVAVVLYRLGSCGEYRLVANQFGIHKATVKENIYMFCKGMVRGLLRDLIQMPNEEEALEITCRFEAWHYIPQIMGLIDGTHIPIHPPSDGYRDFVKRKGWPSYVLQAVVDDRFWSISCKMPGCAHDALVFHNSDLLQSAHLLPKSTQSHTQPVDFWATGENLGAEDKAVGDDMAAVVVDSDAGDMGVEDAAMKVAFLYVDLAGRDV
ncbi:hypothetical protein ABVT39_024490 [Epinephelus coioides]